MAKEQSKWAIGIGIQPDQAVANPVISGAIALKTGAADGTGATGILLRSEDDINLSMARLSEDLGQVPGSLSRLGSVFRSTDPSLSFTIDMMGNRITTGVPDAGDYDLPEYMVRILAGARLEEFASNPANTIYSVASTQEYQTIKVWRSTESWTLVACTFDLSWAFVAGERARMTVTVFADSVEHDDTEVFPTTALSDAYGNQLGAPPIFQQANATLASTSRGMQSATVAMTHAREVLGDCNFLTGKANTEGQRTVSMDADWYVDDADDDFLNMEANLGPAGAGPLREVLFSLGQSAGAGVTANAFQFKLYNFEFDDLGEVNSGDNAVRKISGHCVTAGASGSGSSADDEFAIFSI